MGPHAVKDDAGEAAKIGSQPRPQLRSTSIIWQRANTERPLVRCHPFTLVTKAHKFAGDPVFTSSSREIKYTANRSPIPRVKRVEKM